MVDQLRSCRRPACRWPAVASLSFRYETGQVWLEDMSRETDPSRWDLCPHHADTLVVPRGWEQVDRRSSSPLSATFRSTERDSDERREPGQATASNGSDRPNRYADLSAALPAVAAAFARGGDGVAARSATALADEEAEAGPPASGGVVVPLRDRDSHPARTEPSSPSKSSPRSRNRKK